MMKKILLILFLLIAAILFAVNLFGAWALAGVLEQAIGAPVKAGRLHVRVFSSSLGLYDFKIQNPPGFHEKTLAEIHEISVDYDLSALLKGRIHLKKMRLDFGDMTLEKNTRGKVNLLELGAVKGITEGFGGREGGEAKSGQPAKGAPEKTKKMELLIDETLVNIGKVRYVDSAAQPPLTKEYDLGIHHETFKDITKTASLVKGITFLILRKVGLSSLSGNLDILAKGVGGEIQSAFDQLKRKLLT